MEEKLFLEPQKVNKPTSIIYTDTDTHHKWQKKERGSYYDHEHGYAKKEKEEVKDHKTELAGIIENVNSQLENSGSSYRFRMHSEGDEVFFDVLIIGEDGRVKKLRINNITHRDFFDFMKHLMEKEGVIFDDLV